MYYLHVNTRLSLSDSNDNQVYEDKLDMVAHTCNSSPQKAEAAN